MVLGSKGTELGIENKVAMKGGLCYVSFAACAGYSLITKVFLPLFLACSWQRECAAEPALLQAGSFCSAEFSSMREVPVGVRVSSRAVSGRDKWRISPGRVPAVTRRCWTVICVLSSHSSSLIKVCRARTTPGGNHSCLPCKMTVDFNSLLIWMFLKFLLKWGQEVMQRLMSSASFVGRFKVFY